MNIVFLILTYKWNKWKPPWRRSSAGYIHVCTEGKRIVKNTVFRISNQEFSLRCIWKFVSFDKNPLLRGWKLLNWNCVWRTKQQRWTKDIDTTLSTPFVNLYFDLFYVHLRACIHYKPVLLLQWPRWKVTLNALFPTGRQNALNPLKIVKLTQNVRTKSNIIETNNWRALRLFIKYVI